MKMMANGWKSREQIMKDYGYSEGKSTNSMKLKQITLRLPEEVNEALKKISQQTGINYSNLVLLACWNNVFQFFQNHK